MTSASPGEGKTTVCSNLAIAMAEIRRKTLLIDADLRRPRVHQIFDVRVTVIRHGRTDVRRGGRQVVGHAATEAEATDAEPFLPHRTVIGTPL